MLKEARYKKHTLYLQEIKGKLIYSERKQISNPPEWKSGSTAKG